MRCFTPPIVHPARARPAGVVEFAGIEEMSGVAGKLPSMAPRGLRPLKHRVCPMPSLRTKLTFTSLGLLLTFVWALAFLTSTFIKPQMEAMQKDRQFEVVQYLAADLDQDMKTRVGTLTRLAAAIDTARMADAAYLQRVMDQHFLTMGLFDGGCVLIGMDGRVRAEWPLLAGRKALDYSERDNFKQAIATRRPYIGRPSIGLSVKRPVLVISVPVIDAAGAVRAVISGIADLTSRTLLGPLLAAKGLGSSEIFVFSLRDNLVIAAPDPKRVLTATPAPGRSAIYDRFRAGFEGSAVGVNSAGIEKLYSAKRLASADWLVEVAIPTEIAFKPIRVLLTTFYSAAAIATVLALLLVGWLTRRALAPLSRAGTRLDAMSGGQMPLECLPEEGEAEVRQLISSFNRLSGRLQRQQSELQYSEATYRSLFDNMLNGFAYCRMVFEDGAPVDFIYLKVNAAFAALTGLTDVVGKPVSKVIPGIRQSDPELFALYGRVARGGSPERREVFVAALQQWFLLSIYSPQPDHFVAVFDVITERKLAEQELRLAATAFEADVGIVVTDAQGVILRVNRALVESTGYSAEEAVGQTPRLFKSDRHDADFYAAMWRGIRLNGAWQGEIWDRRKNGEIYPKWMIITAVKGDDGEIVRYVSTQTDITARKIAEDEIKYLAFYDQLTRLPNRRLLLERLRLALAAGARGQQQRALLFIDLDDFKTLNDSLGHDHGDLLLQQVAQRLAGAVREADLVARLGGDEFVVMLDNLGQTSAEAAIHAEGVGEKILDALKQPYALGGHEYQGSASVGVTLFGDCGGAMDELLKQADLAMYRAKTAGRNAMRFFDPAMQAAVTARVELEKDLRNALRAGEFVLHYQAQVDVAGRLPAAEVLVRWRHPQRGLVFPNDFIGLAEETGLILPLGYWVLEAACAQLAAWAGRADAGALALAVNVSVQQLRQPDFVAQVLAVLERTGADPRKLKLELTESQLMDNVEETIDKMAALKARGVGFALDDFGTGYSSLSYLKRLPLEKLKIDRSFVKDVLTDPNDAAITQTIVALAKSLGLGVVAEGVETAAQRDFLVRNGCHLHQGYLFSKPLPLADFESFLIRREGREMFDEA
jgi:diguanylate cyclase (GGDEF)-like protein/PAS domain S-box-containing protein